MKNKLKISKYLIINLITIVFFLLLPYYIFNGKPYLGGDDTRLLYSYPYEYLKNTSGFFAWANLSTLGINASGNYLFPFLIMWMMLKTITNNTLVLNYLAFSLPIIIGFKYFQKFIKELFMLENKYSLEIYLGTLFFILSPIIIFDQLFIFLTTIWLLALIPSVGYYYIKYLKTSNFKYIYISMVICILLSISLLSVPWILGLALPISIGLLFVAFLYKKKDIFLFLKRSIIFLFFIILSQSFWLLGFLAPYLLKDTNSYAEKFISKGFLDTFSPTVLSTATGSIIYPLLNLFHRQIAFDFAWKLKDVFVNFYDKTFFLNLGFILIIISGAVNYKKYLDKTNRKIYILLFISFIFSLYFFTVNIGPLKDLFLFFGRIPGFVMFRNFYDKFAPGYVIIYSVLISVSLIILRKKFGGRSKYLLVAILILIIFNALPIKETVNSPLWSTQSIYKTVDIPNEYMDFMNQINKKISSTNTILSIPFGVSLYTVIKENGSNNSYVGVSPVKILSGVNDISGTMSFNFTDQIYTIDNIIIKRDYSNLNSILYQHNINYVLVTKNIPKEVLDSYVFSPLSLKVQDSKFIQSITSKKLLTSENGNYVLYATKEQNSLIKSQNLYFQKINPVKYVIYIRNLKTPQKLEFNDSFHGDWKLYLQNNPNLAFCRAIVNITNGNNSECKSQFSFFDPSELSFTLLKPIFDNTHSTVGGYYNSWRIDPKIVKNNFNKSYYTVNKDGSLNIELILYFNEQLYFYYGIAITALVLLLSSIYLLYKSIKKYENKT